MFFLSLLAVGAVVTGATTFGFADSRGSIGAWSWGSTWCGTGEYRARNGGDLDTLNDVLALTWSTPSSQWASWGKRFGDPSSLVACAPSHSGRDFYRLDCIAIELLRSRAHGEAAFIRTIQRWGSAGAYYAVVMHMAEPTQLERVLAVLDLQTRTWVVDALAPIDWLSQALRSSNPFDELGRLGGLDARRIQSATRRVKSALRMRSSPFLVVGWTLRWRAEDKLVDAYRAEARRLMKGEATDCAKLYALHHIATPGPPKALEGLLRIHSEIPACSEFAREFQDRDKLHPGMMVPRSTMFAASVVGKAARQASVVVGSNRVIHALGRAALGLVPEDLDAILMENEERALDEFESKMEQDRAQRALHQDSHGQTGQPPEPAVRAP